MVERSGDSRSTVGQDFQVQSGSSGLDGTDKSSSLSNADWDAQTSSVAQDPNKALFKSPSSSTLQGSSQNLNITDTGTLGEPVRPHTPKDTSLRNITGQTDLNSAQSPANANDAAGNAEGLSKQEEVDAQPTKQRPAHPLASLGRPPGRGISPFGGGNNPFGGANLMGGLKSVKLPEDMKFTETNKEMVQDACAKGLETDKSFIALECLANDPKFAKSDLQKDFICWESPRELATITEAPNLGVEHEALRDFFLKSEDTVRFPYNTGDSHPTHSLSPKSVSDSGKPPSDSEMLVLPRFGTCSRSCFALIPVKADSLAKADSFDPQPRHKLAGKQDVVSKQEWAQMQAELANPQGNRFGDVVENLSVAARQGIEIDGQLYKLYSVKTGIDYVGSKYEGPNGGDKHLLEGNSTMAMLRSEVLAPKNGTDTSIGFQTELLTITTPLKGGGSDGFQVRDLSCLRPDLNYIPGQAIPHAGDSIRPNADWRSDFTEPLGRAKANLFLNTGLVHTSANAQNFVVGFGGEDGKGKLEQFVLRDVGDTSWHDNYVGSVLGDSDAETAFQKECQSEHRHLLSETSSGAYAAPNMVRLAAFSVGTHGFAEALCQTDNEQHYNLLSGVIDGFRGYCEEVLTDDFKSSSTEPKLSNDELQKLVDELDIKGEYPHSISKTETVKAFVEDYKNNPNKTPEMLLDLADQVKEFTKTKLADTENTKGDVDVRKGIRAEEFLVCIALEKSLDNPDVQQKLTAATQGQTLPQVVKGD